MLLLLQSTPGNVYNCSGRNPPLKSIPLANDHLHKTNWVDLSYNEIANFSGSQSYLKSISGLNLSNNSISTISSETVEMLRNGKIKEIDLSANRIRVLPEEFKDIPTLTSIRLSGNPFICDCSMIWMINWTIVEDYYKLTCNDVHHKFIHTLNPGEMGCFPLTLGQKILIEVSAGATVAIVIAIIAISRRWNEVKWFMYLHFDILSTNDGDENLEIKKSDALLSYRYISHVFFGLNFYLFCS